MGHRPAAQRRSAAAGIRLDSRWQDIQSVACSAGKICVLRRPVLRRVRQPVRLPAWAAAGGVSLQGPLPRGVHRRRVDEDALHPAAGVPDGRLRRVGQPAYAQPYQRPGRHVARKRYEAGDLGRPVDSLIGWPATATTSAGRPRERWVSRNLLGAEPVVPAQAGLYPGLTVKLPFRKPVRPVARPAGTSAC